MTTNRLQHIVPAGTILLLATIVTWLSFTQEPAESFLFPRVISIFFIALSVWNFIRAVSGLSRVGTGISTETLKNITPGLLVMIIFVFFAAKAIGFYVASIAAFFAIYSFYDPADLTSVKDWIKRGLVTAAFMAIIYGIFSLVLQVQTPRGLFI
jgi:hypothetical protein